MESKEKAKLIYDTLDNKLAVDVSIIDISSLPTPENSWLCFNI